MSDERSATACGEEEVVLCAHDFVGLVACEMRRSRDVGHGVIESLRRLGLIDMNAHVLAKGARALARYRNEMVAPTLPPKLRLEEINQQIEKLEQERSAIFRASLHAPASEKVTTDDLARLLGEEDLFAKFTYPITVHGIESSSQPLRPEVEGSRYIGSWVAVRPCKPKGEPESTHLGIYLGDFATYVGASFHKENGVLVLSVAGRNPAMWVPDLKRVVYGMESWWRRLKTPEDLQQIQDTDIHSVFYVRALRDLTGEPTPSEVEAVKQALERDLQHLTGLGGFKP